MQLNAAKREARGKKAKSVRKERKIPAVIFGSDIDSISIAIDYREFLKAYKESGETTLIDIIAEGTKEPYRVLVKEVQVHPVDYAITHVSFHKVNLKEKTSADIPVVIENEENVALVKSGEALVLTQLNEITVEALPTDLPHEFVVDVSGFAEIGDVITVADLIYDHEKVEIVDHGLEDVVVILDYATIEEVEEEEVAEEELIGGLEATKESVKEEAEEGSEKGKSSENTEETVKE